MGSHTTLGARGEGPRQNKKISRPGAKAAISPRPPGGGGKGREHHMDLFPKFLSEFVAQNVNSIPDKGVPSSIRLEVEESGGVKRVTRASHQQEMCGRGGGLREKTAKNLRLIMKGNLRDKEIHRLRSEDAVKGVPKGS